MKKSIFSLILLLLFVFTPGMTCRKDAQIKYDKNVGLVDSTKKAIAKNETKIEDKGKAFVYGAKYANEQETNRTPAIDISSKFLDLAQISLGNPSLQDSILMRDITDNLLKEVKIKLELEKQRGDLTEKELKESNKLISAYKKDIESANLQLNKFSNDIILLQKDKEILNNNLNKSLEKLDIVNKENADLAAKWQEENIWYKQLNPFTDLFSFFKKLFGWGIFLGIGFIIFKVLEIFFPALNILGVIFSPIVTCIKKFIPSAIKGASLISSKVYSGFKGLVKATEDALKKIEEMDIESKIIKNYPDDYKFTKTEVKTLLEQHSESIEAIIKEELKEHSTDEDRALVTKAKIDLGIKSEAKNIEI